MTREEWREVREGLYRARDFASLAVFADWCEETNQPDARLQRWLADHRKMPYRLYKGSIFSWEPAIDGYNHFWMLPATLFECLPEAKPLPGRDRKLKKGRYRSLEEAENALAKALATWELTLAARTGGV